MILKKPFGYKKSIFNEDFQKIQKIQKIRKTYTVIRIWNCVILKDQIFSKVVSCEQNMC